MKLSILMIFLTVLQMSANSFSQNLNLSIENGNLKDVFQEIEEQCGYTIFYKDNHVNFNRPVNINVKEAPIQAVLDQVLDGTSNRYSIVDKIIVILPQNENLQQHTVTGTVTNVNGEPLPGVNIIEQGTTQGSVTDLDGNYSITVSSPDAILEFSFVGYLTEEVEVNGQTNISLTMIEDIKALDEVVVIGYGSQQRSDITGSVASFTVENETQGLNITSADQLIQGRLAGVNVKQASNAPGGVTSVRIRGSNSFLGSNEPLYVIDGVPVFNDANELISYGGPGTVGTQRINPPNPLSFLNPASIESINVLKDASATAIYGARGSNGVIIITTKKGQAGQANLDINYSNGWQSAMELPEMMNTSEFQQYYQQHQDNPNSPEHVDGREPFSFANTRPDTDWLDEITREGVQTRNFSLSASGGNEQITYSIGGSYYDQEGVLIDSDMERYNMRLNLNANISDRIRVGNSLVASRTTKTWAWVDGTARGIFGMGSMTSAMYWYPFQPLFDEEGEIYRHNTDGARELMRSVYNMNHPVGLLTDQQDLRETNRMLGNLFAEVDILEDLYLKVSVGGDIESRDNSILYTEHLSQGPRIIRQSNNRQNFINENTLNYKLSAGDHSIDAVGGFTVQQNTTVTDFSQEVNFPFDRLSHEAADAQATDILTTFANKNKWTMASWLGRVNYGYQGKYLLTASVRADGSSRFAEDEKWGVFPSAAVAWRISEEPFMQQAAAVDNLKLRTSYGVTGNSEIGVNQSLLTVGQTRYSFDGREVSAFYPSGPENSGLRWEQTKQTDIGLDVSLFNYLLTLTFDVYWKDTEDLLVSVPLDPLTGFGSTLLNIGGIENNGFDIDLTGNWINTADFAWTTNFNYSQYRNEVIEISPLEDEFSVSGAVERGEYRSYVKVGEPLGAFRGFETDGLISQADIDAGVAHPGTPELGDIKYVDQDGDGTINEEDYTVIGNPHPDFTFGVFNSFRYKMFDLSALISGSIGHDIFNTSAFYGRDPRILTTNKYAALLDSWTPDNPNASYPRAGSSSADGQFKANDLLAIEDGSFVKIQNISLGVNLSRNIIKFADNLRIYVSAQNLAIFTDYTGTSPEVNSGGQSTLNLGYDTGGYPLTRTFTIGANLSL